MSMYGDCYTNYPQYEPIQWRNPQWNYRSAASDSPPLAPLLTITVIVILFLCMSVLSGFFKAESHQSCSGISLYIILIILFLMLLYVAWCKFWDSFMLANKPPIWYDPHVGQHVDGVSVGGEGGGLSVMMVVAVVVLVLALVFCNPILSVPVALAGALNMLATVS